MIERKICESIANLIDTSIAELVKEMTDSDAFQEALHVEQDLLHGQDTDRVNPYIEDFICKHEPIMKVARAPSLQVYLRKIIDQWNSTNFDEVGRNLFFYLKFTYKIGPS